MSHLNLRYAGIPNKTILTAFMIVVCKGCVLKSSLGTCSGGHVAREGATMD